MQTEFELKFLWEDHTKLQSTIIEHGGMMRSPMTMMKRMIFDLSGDGEFIRVRDEWDKVTMSYKKMISQAIDGVKEINLAISNFDAGVAILKAGGLKANSYQESYRSVFELDGCEICFDRWPGINEYVEIEWDTQEQVEQVITILWLDMSQWFGGTVNSIYQKELWLDASELETIPELTFASPPKSRLY